jgi:uncharacterized protein (DUF2336 family)
VPRDRNGSLYVEAIVDISQSVIAELEESIRSGSKEKRVESLRRITDLFVADADRLNDHQIDLFDDVLGHLIKRIEGKALAELSQRLGPINNAPVDVVQRLARHDDIAVAEPILARSTRLNDSDLIEIASTKAHAYLLAISARPHIATEVTDVLLQSGSSQVYHRLASNSGANFSETGFARLVKHAERDDKLAETMGLRLDLPLRLFRELLLRATEAVRSRLLAMAGPESREQIQRVLAAISEDTRHEAGFQNAHDAAEAQARVLAMRSTGSLNEASVFEFAKTDRYAEMVAALSLLCGAPVRLVESLLQSDHCEALLIPCKAAKLEWPTVRLILTCRSIGYTKSVHDLDRAQSDYARLSPNTAARVLRFWQVRQSASPDATSQPRSDAAGTKSLAQLTNR